MVSFERAEGQISASIISLKPEQKVAVNALLTGEDVFIVSLMEFVL